MANGIPDIRVLVGNTGDATLSAGGSGAIIRQNLMAVAKQISDQQSLKVAVYLDTSTTQKRLQGQLNRIVDGLKPPSINLNTNINQATTIPKGQAANTVIPNVQSAASNNIAGTNAMAQAAGTLTEALRVENAVLSQLYASLETLSSAISKNASSHSGAAASIQDETTKRQQSAQATKAQDNATAHNTATQEKSNKVVVEARMALAQFNRYLQTIKPKGLSRFAGDIESVRRAITTAIQTGLRADLQSAKNGITDLKANFKTLGFEGGNAFTYLGGKIKTFTTYLASSAVTMGLINGVRNLIQSVKDLDASLTDLRIVTGGTRMGTQALLGTYNQMAQELGSTTTAVANSAVEWKRQGYSLSDTNTLIKDSMVLSTIGFIDEKEAATALTAAMKGYQLSAEQAMSVVDKFTATDMVAATSAGTLATALSKTAANAKLAGLSLDDVVGQLAVVNETMQEGGEQTGTFYNTMLSRMGNIKAGRLEDPETSEDLSDVEATLNGLGIKLRDSESEFRNFGNVLSEVGSKWGSFSSVQQRAIATAFAGTRQQTRFISLMNGWGKSLEYSEVAANSAGTALQKFSVYGESVEAKANKMASAFDNLAVSLIDSRLIGGIFDFNTALFNTVAAFPDWLKNMAAAVAILVTLKAALNGIRASAAGAAFVNTFKDLGWPEYDGRQMEYCA